MRYHASLINWVEERLSEQPDDPFLPFLLSNGMQVGGKILEEQVRSGKVPRFDPDTSAIVSRLRFGVIERKRLGPSPAADMARCQIWLGPCWP